MRGFRALPVCATVLVAAGLVLTLRGQTAGDWRLQILEHVGLPAIDEGMIADESHTPSSPETLRRAALLEALLQDRAGASGGHYRPGRVIVKFRDEAAMPDRRAAVRAASDTGEIAVRPSYADFDIVRIDPAEDAEEAASVLRQRPEVQYAQAAYRVHALFVPNDPVYAQQWNLPMINMEKAWDIQPQAGSAITVAVIDTGMAYENAALTPTLQSFRSRNGTVYPALGRVFFLGETLAGTPNPVLLQHHSRGRQFHAHNRGIQFRSRGRLGVEWCGAHDHICRCVPPGGCDPGGRRE